MTYQEFKRGIECTHPVHGKVETLFLLPNSYTRVQVKDIERGKGWDEFNQRYRFVQVINGGYNNRNLCYGAEYTVHIKDLKPCIS